MTQEEIYAAIKGVLDGEQIRAFAKQYREYPLKLSFSAYAQGIDFLAREYLSCGLETKVTSFPADGRSVYGDRHFPLAWDVEAGWLEVDGKRLADYAQDTYSIVPFSADSAGVQCGRIIPSEELPDKLSGDEIALFTHYPAATEISALRERGLQAYLACVNPNPVHPSLEDSRRWFNDAFGAGQIDARHQTICGFSITPREARKLLEKYRSAGPVPAQYLLQSRTFSGQAPCVSATIAGRDQRVFWLTAHAYEPHATNNVAGVACLLAAARALQQLIADGTLPQPQHSIRFFHGLEVFSLYAYALRYPEEMANAIGGMSVDSLGRREFDGYQERFVLWQDPRLRQDPLHQSALALVKIASADSGIGYYTREGSSNNEDLLQDPGFGPPWSLLYGSLWSEPGTAPQNRYFYHSNTDTADKLSPLVLRTAAAIAAAQAYYCASQERPAKPAHSLRTAVISTGNTALEKECDRMIVQRLLPGPLGFGTLSDDLRAEAAQILGYHCLEYWVLEDPGSNLYLFDGRRSVFEVAQIAGPEKLEKYQRLALLLEKAGLARITRRSIVGKQDILTGLQSLGIARGALLMVHSSLRSFGKIVGGAEVVIEALQELVGPEGIIAMPAFTDAEDGSSEPPFVAAESPVEKWVGVLPEVFRLHPGVIRSQHPTHSVCAWGDEAQEFLASETPLDIFSVTSPWRKLLDRGGKLLFLGEAIGGNTYLHALEAWHLGYMDETYARMGDKVVKVQNYPDGCRGGWYKLKRRAPYWQALEKTGIIQETTIGDARVTLLDVQQLTAAMLKIFAADPAILLHKSGCRDCAQHRARISFKPQ